MPVLRRYNDESGYYARGSSRDDPSVYVLSIEGQRFLTDVLGMRDGSELSARDLAFLLDRGWAKLQAPEASEDEPPPARAPTEAPAAGGVVRDPREVEPEVASRPKKPSAAGKQVINRRTRAREVALQVLYLMEQNSGVDPNEVARFIERRLSEAKTREFAESLVAGARANQPRIDDLISGVAENWRLDRMAAIDRNILRLGAYEMLFCPDVPTKVAINEALELAKRYSTAQSSRFVNGILDRLQGAETNPAPAASDSPETELGPEPVAEPPAAIDPE
jgi:transcription antitermination protein NusB